MTLSPARIGRTLKRSVERRLPKRRDDSGLTTLEWLLIVAAVAGLAALAVVLVQSVVSDTADQIAGSSARKTGAQVAASAVQEDAAGSTQPSAVETWGDWIIYHKSKCERIGITYSDVEPKLEITATFAQGTGTGTAVALDKPVVSANVTRGSVTNTAPTGIASITKDKFLAECHIP